MAGVDCYLIHSFDAVEDERTQEGLEAAGGQSVVLPMLVRVSDPSVAEAVAAAEDCRMTSRMGDIMACTGSIRTIQALQKDSRVISIEASRPGSSY